MKILHILNDGPTGFSSSVIETQKKDHDVTVIELAKKDSFDALIDAIFAHDRVVSW